MCARKQCLLKTRLCGRVSLRTGTFILATYTMLIGAMGAALCIKVLIDAQTTHQFISNIRHEAASEFYSVLNENDFEQAFQSLASELIPIYIALAMYITWFSTGVMLCLAAAKGCRWLLLPWIPVTLVISGCSVATVVTGILTWASGHIGNPASQLTTILLNVFILIPNIYGILIIISFFRQKPDIRANDLEDREIAAEDVHQQPQSPFLMKDKAQCMEGSDYVNNERKSCLKD